MKVQVSGSRVPAGYSSFRAPEGALGPEGRCFFFPRLFLWNDGAERKKLAAMCRRPVVATTVGGVPEVVSHGKTGLLVPYGDSKALATAVTELLADAGRMKRMGDEGRRLALERHTWPRVVDRILKAYGEAVR